LDACLPSLIVPEEPRTILDSSENDAIHFNKLKTLRRSHQKKQAETGIRKQQPAGSHEDLGKAKESETKQSRKALLREFHAIIKAEEDRSIATAMGCKLRWEQGSQPGRKPAMPTTSESAIAGNSANAHEVAVSEAKKVCTCYHH
jgi:hypothetical protein